MNPRRGSLLISGAVAALGGAATYLCVLAAYAQASVPAAVLVGAAAAGQAVLAVALLRRPSRQLIAAAAAAAAGLLLLWLVTRIAGMSVRLPLWEPLDTTVGVTDIVDAALEALTAVLLAFCAVRWPRRRARHPIAMVMAAALPVLLAGLLTVAGTGLATNGFTSLTDASGRVLEPGQRLAPGTATALTYCSPGFPLTMEVWEPPAGLPRPAAAVVYVHGGGMTLGSRQVQGLGASLADHAGALFPGVRAGLLAQGIVVASIDYRLAPLTPWPGQLEDAQCAVRFLRFHAAALGIAPGRIGAYGSSAGGELAALLGTAPRAGAAPYPSESTQVQAVADLFGPADLNAMGRNSTPFGRAMVNMAFGSSRAVRAAASPVSYIHRGEPPFLILQGTADPMVPPSQSLDLARQLTMAGGKATLMLVRGAGHGINNQAQYPSPASLTSMITEFFVRTLKPGA